jgi:hypothetical protein
VLYDDYFLDIGTTDAYATLLMRADLPR